MLVAGTPMLEGIYHQVSSLLHVRCLIATDVVTSAVLFAAAVEHQNMMEVHKQHASIH